MQVSQGRGKAIIAEINITPLTDIFLVLLIIIIVVAPVVASERREIKAPNIEDGAELEQGRITVEVTADGITYLDGIPMRQEALSQALVMRSETAPGKDLVIRSDKSVKSGVVMQVLAAAKAAQFKRVMIVGAVGGETKEEPVPPPPPLPDVTGNPAP